MHRAQYFQKNGDELTFLEKTLKFASKYQESQNSAQVSLFGESSEVQIAEPEIPDCETWGTMEELSREKEVVGIFLSGHPLDDFRIEMENYTTCSLNNIENFKERQVN